ncbi:MAG TPA: benzoate-CoA ligase family protein [Candidatus Binatia bacterium]|jgi:2-aminobenzoate-CoA ligase|nr:benzoate-CoA ligase family protein [Candidatus Binatia bacterium]
MPDFEVKKFLPPLALWPQRDYVAAGLSYPEKLNAAEELVRRNLESGFAHKVAIYYGQETTTYAELSQAVQRLAGVLASRGVGKGDRVLLRVPNTPDFIVSWLAVLHLGAIAVATVPLLRERELEKIVRDAEIKTAVVESEFLAEAEKVRERVPELKDILITGERRAGYPHIRKLMAYTATGIAAEQTRRDDIALLAYTSGSTGDPKGTIHFHEDVLAIADGVARQNMDVRPEDISAGHPTLAFTFGLGGLLVFPFRFGASTVLLDRFTPQTMLQTLKDYKATIAFCAPTCFHMMLDLNQSGGLPHLRLGVSGGAALPPVTYKRWRERYGSELLEGIGATEMLHMFICNHPGAVRPGSCGTVVRGYEATVVDENLAPVPPGEAGLLAVRGPTGCRYWKKLDRQQEYVKSGWNLTGDVFTYDTDGYFWFRCRRDDIIVSAGYNIAGPEVENVLLEHPAVQEAAVVGVPDALRGQVVKAFVVLRPGFTGGEQQVEELQDFVKQELAPYKYPRQIEFVGELPHTPTGKIQRFRLRRQEPATS